VSRDFFYRLDSNLTRFPDLSFLPSSSSSESESESAFSTETSSYIGSNSNNGKGSIFVSNNLQCINSFYIVEERERRGGEMGGSRRAGERGGSKKEGQQLVKKY